ncbi:MAG: hypothetical protein AVDCRST_MAG02-3947, partial [uncultured Rubrobacteraceae bacterium]
APRRRPRGSSSRSRAPSSSPPSSASTRPGCCSASWAGWRPARSSPSTPSASRPSSPLRLGEPQPGGHAGGGHPRHGVPPRPPGGPVHSRRPRLRGPPSRLVTPPGCRRPVVRRVGRARLRPLRRRRREPEKAGVGVV